MDNQNLSFNFSDRTSVSDNFSDGDCFWTDCGWKEWSLRIGFTLGAVVWLILGVVVARIPENEIQPLSTDAARFTTQVEQVKLEIPEPVTWRPIFQGIELARIEVTSPTLQKALVIRADLEADGVKPFMTPPVIQGEYNTISKKTSTVLKEHQLAVCVNVAGIAKTPPLPPPWFRLGNVALGPNYVAGVGAGKTTRAYVGEGFPARTGGLIWNGTCYDADNGGCDVIAFTTQGKPRFIHYGDRDRQGDQFGIGGFIIQREHQINREKYTTGRMSLNTIGYSDDGRYLYFMQFEGEQPAYSNGATAVEARRWAEALEIDNLISVSSGGSTTMVIADRRGNPQVLNRPTHLNIPAFERAEAFHLGLYAQPLP